jgi:dihydroxyacetone kinase-like protein
MITLDAMVKWLDKLADVYDANKTYLTDLDSAIGDADHGINMARGFAAVKAALAQKPPASLADACKTTSMTLIKTVGGASGPLYGTLFMKMGPQLPGDSAGVDVLAKALAEGVEGIKKMGKSQTGEKTMLDAWVPALAAMQSAVVEKLSDKDAIAKAVAAAEKGMKDTIPMLATKGRASYLGERSVGHQDPGATSTYLMLKTLSEVVA